MFFLVAVLFKFQCQFQRHSPPPEVGGLSVWLILSATPPQSFQPDGSFLFWFHFWRVNCLAGTAFLFFPSTGYNHPNSSRLNFMPGTTTSLFCVFFPPADTQFTGRPRDLGLHPPPYPFLMRLPSVPFGTVENPPNSPTFNGSPSFGDSLFALFRRQASPCPLPSDYGPSTFHSGLPPLPTADPLEYTLLGSRPFFPSCLNTSPPNVCNIKSPWFFLEVTIALFFCSCANHPLPFFKCAPLSGHSPAPPPPPIRNPKGQCMLLSYSSAIFVSIRSANSFVGVRHVNWSRMDRHVSPASPP